MSRLRRLLLVVLFLSLSACRVSADPPADPTPAAALPTIPATAAATAAVAPTTSSPAPVATATTLPSPTALAADDDIAAVRRAQDEALPRDPFALAAAFRGVPLADATPTVNDGDPPASDVFWMTDLLNNSHYTVTARLAYSSDRLLFYAVDEVAAGEADYAASARVFEEETLPGLLQLFGNQVEPPQQITVLLAPIPGAGGYYSAEDELPAAVNPRSNQRPMVYMNSAIMAPGSANFDSTLAHEMQHLLHQRLQPSSPNWFDEGLSLLAERLLGYGTSFTAESYLSAPDRQLNHWADRPDRAIEHYGAAALFFSYLQERLDGAVPWPGLVRDNAGQRLELLPPLTGDETIGDLVADWAVANLLDDPLLADGRYSYEALPRPVDPAPVAAWPVEGEIQQLGVDYLEIPADAEERRLAFIGDTSVPLVDADLEQGERVWWSGRGDGRTAVLTGALDLRGATEASLSYEVWYDLESGYDYAFVAASRDGGRTWETLPTAYGTGDDPHGLNYGWAYNGRSAGAAAEGEQPRWLAEELDLSAYAGSEIQVGFWVLNDQGYNAPGLLVRNLQVAGSGVAPPAGWHASGFVEIQNRLPQQWTVRLVLRDTQTEVRSLEVRDGRAEFVLPSGMQAVLVVVAGTPETTEPSRYRIEPQP